MDDDDVLMMTYAIKRKNVVTIMIVMCRLSTLVKMNTLMMILMNVYREISQKKH